MRILIDFKPSLARSLLNGMKYTHFGFLVASARFLHKLKMQLVLNLNNSGGNKGKETFHPSFHSLLSGFWEPQDGSLKSPSLQPLFLVTVCQEKSMWQLNYSTNMQDQQKKSLTYRKEGILPFLKEECNGCIPTAWQIVHSGNGFRAMSHVLSGAVKSVLWGNN